MMWSLVNYGTGFDNQANVMLINKSLKMPTISVSPGYCGVASKNICLNHPKDAGQSDLGLTIGQSSTASGAFCGLVKGIISLNLTQSE